MEGVGLLCCCGGAFFGLMGLAMMSSMWRRLFGGSQSYNVGNQPYGYQRGGGWKKKAFSGGFDGGWSKGGWNKGGGYKGGGGGWGKKSGGKKSYGGGGYKGGGYKGGGAKSKW